MSEARVKHSAIAGFSAGLVHILFFPLEMARLHLIVSDGHSRNMIPRYSNALDVLKSLYSTYGLRSLYRGWFFTLNNSFSWAIYFTVYEHMKRITHIENDQIYHFAVALQTSIVTKIIANPVAVVKTRVMLTRRSRGALRDVSEAVMKIWTIDGAMGFYRGMVPGLLLGIHGALSLALYEEFKGQLQGMSIEARALTAGGLSKACSLLICYPLITIRYRLQQEQNGKFLLTLSKNVKKTNSERFYYGVLDVISKTREKEGFTGFYRGLGISLFRLVPEYALFFYTFERMKLYLESN